MPKFNVLVLLNLYTHVIANRLNSNYTGCAVMAEWLMHLTKDVLKGRGTRMGAGRGRGRGGEGRGGGGGGHPAPGSSLSRSQLQTFHPWMLMFVWVFFLPATVKALRTREQQGIHGFTVFIKLTTK